MGNKVINTTSVKLGIYEESTDSQLAGMLGDVKEFEDGRKFRLCSNGTGFALAAGLRLQSVAVGSGDDVLTITAADAGQKEITATANSSGTYSAHALKDGYLVVSKGPGDLGTFYKIKDNEALTTGATGVITLYDDLTTALVASTNEITICPNPYKAVIKDVLSAPLAGVPLINVTKSTSSTTYYFWALFKGFGPAIQETSGSTAPGDPIERVSAGLVKKLTTGTSEEPIGVSYSNAATNEAMIVKYF